MHGVAPITEILILLVAAVAIVGSFKQIRIEPVLGYVVAGAFIGPHGLQLIEDVETTSAIAEFGVVFLLFVIGMELSFERLRQMRWHVFGLGSLQVLITAGVVGSVVVGLGYSASAAIVIGCGLALSSTAIVIQVIESTGEKSTQVGRLALAVLILQDLVVLLLLVLVPQFAVPGSSLISSLIEAIIKATVAIFAIILIGRLLFRPLFRFIASLKQQEIFSATTLLVVLGVAWLCSLAGLSLALGAFLAGLLVAETEYRHQVEADIQPYKGLLLGLFFMSVGMVVDVDYLMNNLILIVGITILLIMVKAAIIIGLSHMFNFSMSASIHSGFLLAQGSEFALVLFDLSDNYALFPSSVTSILVGAITLSMAFTPLLAKFGKRLGSPYAPCDTVLPKPVREEIRDLSQHVIIAGMGRVGFTVARLLDAERIPYAALDLNPELVAKRRKDGIPVYFGDASRSQVLHSVRLERAKAVIVTHGEKPLSVNTVNTIRKLDTTIPIIVRAKDLEQVQRLEQAGASLAIAEMFETSLQIGASVLKELGVVDHEINRLIETFRQDDYALARDAIENTPSKAAKNPHYSI